MQELDLEAIVRVRRQLAPWFKPKAWIYWTDLSASAVVSWVGFGLAVTAHTLVARVGFGALSMFAALRALAFTHELEHQRQLRRLRVAFHVLVGMPWGIPHFMYRDIHRHHHSPKYYGTLDDPEYVLFAHNGSWPDVLLLLVLPLFFPVLVLLRYVVLAPASLCSRSLRGKIVATASSFCVRTDYTRKPPGPDEVRAWTAEEVSTSMFMIAILATLGLGYLPSAVFFTWYGVLAGFTLINNLRLLGLTHGYTSRGRGLSFEEQIRDTVDVVRWPWLHVLIAPVGLQWHATHHLFPTLPYYALARAQRLLLRESEGPAQPLGFYSRAQRQHLGASLAWLIENFRRARLDRRPRPAAVTGSMTRP
jgi:fatty acid desaturase